MSRDLPVKPMRLDKWLCHMGVGTRSQLRVIIKQGVVHVNGKKEKDPGRSVLPGRDQVVVNGQEIPYQAFTYLMLHKPKGVISATDDRRQRTVLDLVPSAWQHAELFPVGRLDKDTTGLLLLTDDGDLAHRLLSPKRHVTKRYLATVNGQVTEVMIQGFAAGVTLEDGYVTMPGQLKIIDELKRTDDGEQSIVEVIIKEGKYHQIKRMFEAFGLTVLELHRSEMGPLGLDPNLQPGEIRALVAEEVAMLEAIAFPDGKEQEDE